MDFAVLDLGLIDFGTALQLQKDIFSRVKDAKIPGALILCQHYPVITLGRPPDKSHLLVLEEELKSKGIEVYQIERGGSVTYHGPGQLTVYPIFDLSYFKKDLHFFLRRLEQVVIDLLLDYGVCAERRFGLTGVWVEDKKIASIGIAVRRWITFHGLSINIKKDDLANFKLIRPCGMDIEMVSVESVLGRSIEIEEIKNNIIQKFSTQSYRIDWCSYYEGGIYDESNLAGIRRGNG